MHIDSDGISKLSYTGKRIPLSELRCCNPQNDLIAQLQGTELGEFLLLPENMLKCNEDVFLDDVTISAVENALQVKTDIVKSSGQAFLFKVLGLECE